MTAQLAETNLDLIPSVPAEEQLHAGAQGESLVMLSKPACVQCMGTKRHLDKKGFTAFTTIDITENLEWYEFAKASGYLQAPVLLVVREGRVVDSWAGYQPGRLDKFVAENA